MKRSLLGFCFLLAAPLLSAQEAWQTTFIDTDNPEYQGIPLPPEYQGLSLSELRGFGGMNLTLPGSLDPTDSELRWVDGADSDNLADIPGNVSPELRGHPLLDELVTDLRRDPVALAAWVQNEIGLVDARQISNPVSAEQIRRGALGVYQERQGSPWEQCALLVHLLRRAGYPAGYASLEDVEADDRVGIWMLVRTSNTMLRLQLSDTANLDNLRRFDYPWVVVYTERSGTGGEWVSLFPWIKDTVVEQGFEPYGFMPSGYQSGAEWAEAYLREFGEAVSPIFANVRNDGRDTPGLLFPRHLEAEVADQNLSLEDFGIHTYDRPGDFTTWDDFPQPYFAGRFQRNLSITQASRSGNWVTVQTSSEHGRATNDTVLIRNLGNNGPTDNDPNGPKVIEVLSPNSFRYQSSGSSTTFSLDGAQVSTVGSPVQIERGFLSSLNVASAQRTDNFVTLTFGSPHGLTEGDAITVSGLASANGTFVTFDTPNAQSLRYFSPGANGSAFAAGSTLTFPGSRISVQSSIASEQFATIQIALYRSDADEATGTAIVDRTLGISAASRSDNLATITTSTDHDLRTGDTVVVLGFTGSGSALNGAHEISVASDNSYRFVSIGSDGNFSVTGASTTVENQFRILSAQRQANLVTLFTARPHLLTTGASIAVAGLTDTVGGNPANGTYTVTVVDDETLTYTDNGSNADFGVRQAALETQRMRLADLHNRQLTVFYDPDSSNVVLELTPFDLADGSSPGDFTSVDVWNAQQDSIAEPSGNVYLEVGVNVEGLSGNASFPGFEFTRRLKEDSLSAICFNAGGVTQQMLDVHAERIQRLNGDSNATASDLFGGLMFLVGQSYWEREGEEREELANLHGVYQHLSYGVCIAALEPEPGETVWAVPSVDIPTRSLFIGNESVAFTDASRNDVRQDFAFIDGFNASAHEHQILNSFFGQDEAISTVRLLQLANDLDPIPDGTDGDGFFTFAVNGAIGIHELEEFDQLASVAEAKNTDGNPSTNPTAEEARALALREAAGSMWGTALDAMNTSSGDPATWRRVYMTPRNIVNGTSGTFDGMGVLYVDEGGFGALISNNRNGGVGEAIPEPSEGFSFVSVIRDTEGNYRYAAFSATPNDPTDPSAGSEIKFTFGYTDNPNIVADAVEGYFTENTTELFLDFGPSNNLSLGSSLATVGEVNREFDWVEEPVTSTQYEVVINTGDLSGTTPTPDPVGQDFTPAPNNNSDPAPFAGDPVNVLTGEFYLDEVDLTLPGPLPLSIRRNYGSQNQAPNLLGFGWRFTLMPYIMVSQEGNQELLYAAELDGSVIAYRKVAGSNPLRWEPQPADNPWMNNYNGGNIGGQRNPFNQFIEATADGFVLVKPNGSRMTYVYDEFPIGDADSTLTRRRPYLQDCTDAFGNALTFEYYDAGYEDSPAYGQVRRIASTNGNYLFFRYESTGNVSEISTNDGRSVAYRYDQFGDLREAERADGSVVRYEYDLRVDSEGDTYSTHLMTFVREPNGRVLRNVYDPTYDPEDTDFDHSQLRRVVEQWATVDDDLSLVQNAAFRYVEAGDSGDPWGALGYDVTYVTSPAAMHASQSTDGVTTYVHRDGLYRFIADSTVASFLPGAIADLNNPTATDLDHVTIYDWFEGDELPGGASPETGAYPRSLEAMQDKRGLVTRYQYDSVGSLGRVTTEGDLDGLANDPVPNETVDTYFFYDSTFHYLEKVIYPAHTAGADQLVVFNEYPDLAGPLSQSYLIGQDTFYRYAYLPERTREYWIASPTLDASNPDPNPANDAVESPDKLREVNYRYGQQTDAEGREAHGLLFNRTTQNARVATDRTETTIAYDGRGYALTATNRTFTTDADVTTDFEYNDRGQVTALIDPAGRTTRLDYDLLGRLESVLRFESSAATEPLSWDLSYYNENGDLTWIDGARYGPEDYVFRDYDGVGRVIAEVAWRTQAAADGSGVEATSGYDPADPASFYQAQSVTYYDYDGFGNLVSVIDPRGNETTMTYDHLGRLLTRTHPTVDSVTAVEEFQYEPGNQISSYTNPLDGVTTIQYNDRGQPHTRSTPDDRETRATYYLDGRIHTQTLSNGSIWTFTFADLNLEETQELRSASNELLAKIIITRDTRGNEVRREVYEDPTTSHVFTAEYDGLNRVTQTQGPASETHPVTGETITTQQTVSTSYTYGGDDPFTLTRVNGEITETVTYDALNRRSAVMRTPTGSSTPDFTQTFRYDQAHQWAEVSYGSNTNDDMTTRVYSNTFGQPVLTVFEDETSTRRVFDEAGNLTNVFNELNLETVYAYDARNRIVQTIRPDSSEVTLTYDAASNVVARTMPGGRVHAMNFDSANRPVWDELRGTNGGVVRRNDYAYYPGGSATPGLLQTRTQNMVSGDEIVHTFAYDARMRLKTHSATSSRYTDVTCFYQYDFRNLVTEITRGSPENPTLVPSVRVLRDYSAYGSLFEETVERGNGLSSNFSPTETISQIVQTWDAEGHRDSFGLGPDVPELGSWTPRIFHEFNANSQLTSITPADTEVGDADGPLWTFGSHFYTVEGGFAVPVAGLRDNGQSDLNIWTINRSSVLTADSDYSSLQTIRTARRFTLNVGGQIGSLGSMRDERGRPVSRLTEFRASGSFTNQVYEVFGRGDDGKITEYDIQHTTAAGTGWTTLNENRAYDYDIATRRIDTETFQPTPGNPTAIETLDYGFDGDGLGIISSVEHETDRGPAWPVLDQTFTWDAMELLIETEQDADVAPLGYENHSFKAVYDGLGRRIWTEYLEEGQTSPAAVTSWYDPQVEFLEIAVEVNGQRWWKVYGNDLDAGYGSFQGIGGLVAVVDESTEEPFFISSDQFGHIKGYVDTTGTNTPFSNFRYRDPFDDEFIFSEMQFSGYGPLPGYRQEPLERSGDFLASLGWQGRRIDPNGLYYNGARSYSPTLRIFIAADPLGHSASLDLYSFCGGDPINYYDPTGRAPGQQTFDGGVTGPILDLYPPGSEFVNGTLVPPGFEYVDGMLFSTNPDDWTPFDPSGFPDWNDPFLDHLPQPTQPRASIGEPGLIESFIPIWGSARASINNFQQGNWGWGLFDAGMAVFDAATLGGAGVAVGILSKADEAVDAFRLFRRHGDVPSPRPPNMQSHHGVNSVWADNNYLNYLPDDAPTVLMRNAPNHNATRGVFNRLRAEFARRQGVRSQDIDWSEVSAGEAWRMAEEMFEAADVPLEMRDDYFRMFNEYLETLQQR